MKKKFVRKVPAPTLSERLEQLHHCLKNNTKLPKSKEIRCMNYDFQKHMQQLAKNVFPNTVVTFGRSGDEWNRLSESDCPQHVVDSFVSKFENDREFFLLNVDGCSVLMQVRNAMEGSEYEKFVVVHDTGFLSSNDQVIATYNSWKDSLQILDN